MPLIEQCAKENNRTIIAVNATFSPSVRDLSGSRGGPSLPEVLNENLSVSESQKKLLSFPEWEIAARFDGVKGYIYGYSVLVWADNGEIRDAGEQGYW